MVNASGKNSRGIITYPEDEVLRSSLLEYARNKTTQAQKLLLLAQDHKLDIGLSRLNELERRLEIPSVRRPGKPKEAIVQAILDEVEKDAVQKNGPNFIKTTLHIQGVPASRGLVRKIMKEQNPDGAQKRFPGANKIKVVRQPLYALGPYHEVAGDGHEKLGTLALQMGGIGLPIYGYRDKWSGKLLKLQVIPDCRSAGAIGHLYLDLVEDLGGIPLQLNIDKGSEIGWQVALQVVLREACSPDIDSEVYHAYALLRSVHNIIIEALWKWLREKCGLNILDVILHGKAESLLKPSIQYHRDLFYWIFVPLVQKELDKFQLYWNKRTVRTQPDKILPSNHVPEDAAKHPHLYGGTDCLIQVPPQIQGELRAHLNETVGTKESFQSFFSSDFDIYASGVYSMIGSPAIALNSSAWQIFTMMSDVMETHI